jgi:hypothetical protein
MANLLVRVLIFLCAAFFALWSMRGPTIKVAETLGNDTDLAKSVLTWRRAQLAVLEPGENRSGLVDFVATAVFPLLREQASRGELPIVHLLPPRETLRTELMAVIQAQPQRGAAHVEVQMAEDVPVVVAEERHGRIAGDAAVFVRDLEDARWLTAPLEGISKRCRSGWLHSQKIRGHPTGSDLLCEYVAAKDLRIEIDCSQGVRWGAAARWTDSATVPGAVEHIEVSAVVVGSLQSGGLGVPPVKPLLQSRATDIFHCEVKWSGDDSLAYFRQEAEAQRRARAKDTLIEMNMEDAK